jgi:hypothetical protein
MPDQLNPPVQLLPCCQKSMQDIRDRLQLGAILRGVAATSGLLNLLGSAPLDTFVSVTTTDWSMFAKAAKANVAKGYCKLIAFDEVQKHPGGSLNAFWERVYEALDE